MDITDLATKIIAQDRRALARAITLVESGRADHRAQAAELVDLLRERSDHRAIRIGLSGTPGVGKSTFIESFGMMLTGGKMAMQDLQTSAKDGLRVAVLAVDPSSARSGGSILGDKTRMDRLSREPRAFIRPSPSQSHLGGVARRTREAVALCEAAGFDVVLIETVGVGQSETVVAEISDLFILLLAPAGGDELQGVKRGIMEMADMILVNKADGDLKAAAMRTCSDYSGALRLLRKRAQDPEGFPKAMTVSALQEDGLAGAWEDMQSLTEWRKAQGHFDARRAAQAEYWFDQEVRQGLLAALEREPLKGTMSLIGARVAKGEITPSLAAKEVLAQLHKA
ncbi:methylmalonyl Co-A mutase-associated GTPase MeaB [Litorivita sp. NS0012-18]|uniref:methylmalonyl Co-A mutase-associated GTPase MeaB n=1 Tax=Litorivita sp. NS0012-18 TaxID=3127655 RepID=UPI00310425FD